MYYKNGHPNSKKTHCPKGHEYTEENTVVVRTDCGSGRARRCHTCIRKYQNKWRREHRKKLKKW